MLSLTFNAPEESFNDADQYLFQGKGVDELFFPMHMNFRFFDMEPLPTFACYDVMKNANAERDFERFQAHLVEHFQGAKPGSTLPWRCMAAVDRVDFNPGDTR